MAAERETTTITEQAKEKNTKNEKYVKITMKYKNCTQYKSNNSNSNDMPLTNRPDTPKSIRKNNSIKHTHSYEHNNKYTKNYHSLVDSVARSLFSNTQNTFSRQWHARVYYGCDTLTCACHPPSAQTTKHSLTHHHETKLVGWLVLYVHLKKLLLLAFNRIENNLLND